MSDVISHGLPQRDCCYRALTDAELRAAGVQ